MKINTRRILSGGTRWLLLIGSCMCVLGCATGEVVRKQYLEFEGFTVENGVYKPKPGWNFAPGKDNTVVVARANDSGIIITPCECALETGGSCTQVTSTDSDDNIKELWCDDQNCGFCVGGTVDPEDPSSNVRFDVVCLKDRAMAED